MKKIMSLNGQRIWVAGHNGMVGRALVRRLATENCQILTATRQDCDLTDQRNTRKWVSENKPDIVILAAAKVGGILANNTYPVDFLLTNMRIQNNVIEQSFNVGVERLLFLGSSCIYPKFSPQPINENALLTGALEPTNEGYAIAKIAGIKLCQAYRQQYGKSYISAMPTNLYGPYDNFDLKSSHVIPALMRKAHEAKISKASALNVWGSGSPLREFLHVDDLADSCIHLLEYYDEAEHCNIGSGSEITIKSLAETIASVTGFAGMLEFDPSKPDGTPQKLMATNKLQALNWKPKIPLKQGLQTTYSWYQNNIA